MYAQQTPVPATPKVYDSVDKMPVLADNFQDYLGRNLRYPDDAREEGVQGRVLIKFVVNEDGSVSDCRVERSISASCDSEVLRVIRAMPKLTPGTLNGVPVKVYFRQPVSFKLEGGSRRRKRK
jgi:protein TonB